MWFQHKAKYSGRVVEEVTCMQDVSGSSPCERGRSILN